MVHFIMFIVNQNKTKDWIVKLLDRATRIPLFTVKFCVKLHQFEGDCKTRNETETVLIISQLIHTLN